MIIKSKNPFIDDKTRNAYYARLKQEKTKKLKERYTTKMPPNKKLFKKVRKHQGIVQTGGNAGRLRKGYRYSGKKLKSGLSQKQVTGKIAHLTFFTHNCASSMALYYVKKGCF